jgi:hypothetical protein
MPESGTSGSVRGARGNSRPYRERDIHPWPSERFAAKHPRWEPYA